MQSSLYDYTTISMDVLFVKLIAGVDFTNILSAAFVPKSFHQKIINPNCKHLKAAQKTFVQKSCMQNNYEMDCRSSVERRRRLEVVRGRGHP